MICEKNIKIFLIIFLFSSGEACDFLKPQKHGDWFCPPSTEAATCHLECHPGYVSTNATVISCHLGEWTEAPQCIAAIAIITGGDIIDPSNTVEVYGEGILFEAIDEFGCICERPFVYNWLYGGYVGH